MFVAQVNTRQQTERKAKAASAQDTDAALAFAKAYPTAKQRGTIQEIFKVSILSTGFVVSGLAYFFTFVIC